MRSFSALAISVVLFLSANAVAQHCDAPREPWMDTLRSRGIKGVSTGAEFDLFPDGRLVLYVTVEKYFNDYVMNGYSQIKGEQLPDDVQKQLRTAAAKAMEEPLRKNLAELHITQGRGGFGYPLFDEPCRSGPYFDARIYGPTPLEVHPVGKRLAVVTDIAETKTLSGKPRTQIKITADDGMAYTCDGPHEILKFRKGDNLSIKESTGYLLLDSLEPNARILRVKLVQKHQLFYL